MGKTTKRGLVLGIICVVLLSSAVQDISNAAVFAKTKQKTILIIGDSIAYGMALGKGTYTGVDRGNEVYWITEGGVNAGFISEELKIKVGNVMPKSVVNTFTKTDRIDLIKEVKDKKIEDIVVMLGTNYPEKKQAEKMVNTLKLIKEKTGLRVYFANLLPYVDKGYYKQREGLIKEYNTAVKEGLAKSGIRYIDLYTEVKNIDNYSNETWDGIHYTKKVYNAVFEKILDTVERVKKKIKKPANKKSRLN